MIVILYYMCFFDCYLDVVVFVVVLSDDVMVLWVGFGYYLCVCNLYCCV